MQRIAAAALMLLAFVPAAAQADPSAAHAWEHIDTEDGISVYAKDVEGSDLVAFRGDGVVDAPLQKVLWVLARNEGRTEWVDRLEESVILEKISDFEYIVYQHFGLPVIMSDRDYVYRGWAVRDAKGVVTLEMHSCEHSEAPETVGVRAELLHSRYVMEPLGPDRTRVTVEIHTDPKGMLPTWLVNLIQESWPRKTLEGIRRQVQKQGIGLYPLPPVAPQAADPKPAEVEEKAG